GDGKPDLLDQVAECDNGGEDEQKRPQPDRLDRRALDGEEPQPDHETDDENQAAEDGGEEARPHPRRGAEGEVAAEIQAGRAVDQKQDGGTHVLRTLHAKHNGSRGVAGQTCSIRRIGASPWSPKTESPATVGRGSGQPRETPGYSMTSLARSRNASGIFRPNALAVVVLTTRSYLVGCSTGMSAGLAPRRILSTCSPARRNRSGRFGP